MVHVGWGLLTVFILDESCPVNHIQVVYNQYHCYPSGT